MFLPLTPLEAGPESDVDILADAPGPPTFDQHMGLKSELEDLPGRRVDLVTRRGLRERIRPIASNYRYGGKIK